MADFRYYARLAPSPTISIALANSGELQVELIEQHDDKPSIYRDFLVSGRSALQHVSAWVTCAEFERMGAELLRRGFQLAQEGTIAATGTRLAYFATDRGPGTIVYEVSDLLDPKHYGRVQRIVEAARAWGVSGLEPTWLYDTTFRGSMCDGHPLTTQPMDRN